MKDENTQASSVQTFKATFQTLEAQYREGLWFHHRIRATGLFYVHRNDAIGCAMIVCHHLGNGVRWGKCRFRRSQRHATRGAFGSTGWWQRRVPARPDS